MQASRFSKGQVIYREGDRLEHVSLIADGEVEGSSGIYTHTLEKSELLGISDLGSGVFTFTYTALSDILLYQYPCTNFDSIEALVQKSPDTSYLMAVSLCKHISGVLRYRLRLRSDAEMVLDLAGELYNEYIRLCKMYAVEQERLPEAPKTPAPSTDSLIPDWVHNYYTEIHELPQVVRKAMFRENAGIVSGFLRIGNEDFRRVYDACAIEHKYLADVSSMLFQDGGRDLFSLISKLHIKTADIEGADFALETLMAPLIKELSSLASLSAIPSGLYRKCLESYWDALEYKRLDHGDIWDSVLLGAPVDAPVALPDTEAESTIHDDKPSPVEVADTPIADTPIADTTIADAPIAGTSITDTPIADTPRPPLEDSLNVILSYAEADAELSDAFAKNVRAYTDLPDRNSPDDDVQDLRRDITKAFFAIYKLVFMKSLSDLAPPTVINMFLNFGYVDLALAGTENAYFLYEIADSFKGDPESNIYTLPEWLASIHKGQREPSLSEFDMDYTAYIRDLKNSKQIDAAEEKRRLRDLDAKLNYEMDNAMPVVNRVTFGKPSKYVPVFSSHNALRSLKDILVTPAAVSGIIEEIRSIDYSAFYRETAYSNQKLGITSEQISVEVLPNIILMPNVGLRGSMWQEIEGRVRTTPARIFLPAFLEKDLKPLVMRLVGELRWEICRRIQGARWNDMTDPSLTSYFCDYLQFYMNNRNISKHTTTEIRNEVSAARNNYKTVFVSNYVTWLQHESRGMARLNSIAIGILMTFCPFSLEIREKLKTNMRYREAFNKYNTRRQKRYVRLTNLMKKLNQTGKQIPPELASEYEFLNK